MSARRLLLVRHGVTEWNREGRFQGHLDPPLSEDGRREAQLLAERLDATPELRPARVVSSTLGRALETASIIASLVGSGTVIPERRLIEIGQGEWEGRTHAELAVRDPDRYEAWRRADGVRQPPGGEPIESASERARGVVDDLVGRAGPWPVCLVSHGGTLRVLARLIFGVAPVRAWSLDVDNASLSVTVETDGRWRLERWNDALHLLGRAATHVDEADGRPQAL